MKLKVTIKAKERVGERNPGYCLACTATAGKGAPA